MDASADPLSDLVPRVATAIDTASADLVERRLLFELVVLP